MPAQTKRTAHTITIKIDTVLLDIPPIIDGRNSSPDQPSDLRARGIVRVSMSNSLS